METQTVLVKSYESPRDRHTDHRVAVKMFNELTGEWETIWEAIRSQPFEVQVEGSRISDE